MRNLSVTGLPTGLALQNIALKFGDSTAEPSVIRGTLSATLPPIELNQLANKVLSTIQETLRSRVWSGGAMWFTAFFAAGWLYVFKAAPVNRLRWLFAISLLVLVVSQAALNSGESERPGRRLALAAHHRLRRGLFLCPPLKQPGPGRLAEDLRGGASHAAGAAAGA